MPRTKLTNRVIEGLKGRPAGSKSKEPVLYFDQQVPGFAVSVSSKTGRKTYVVQRDMPDGKSVRRVIGLVGTEIKSLDEARAKAGEIIQDLRKGIDPKAAAKATAKGEVTLSQAAEEYVIAHPNLAPKSIKDYRRNYDSYLGDWKSLKLNEITRDDVERRHLELGEQRGKATANGVMRGLRALFNWAIDRYPDVIANPVRLSRKQWFKIDRRTRHVSADNAARFYQAILALENSVARDYLLLLLFTGLRREEAAGLTWQDIDFTGEVIRLPALRTKAKRQLDLPMSDFVFKMLKKRRNLGDAHFVFPANSRSGRISEPKHPLGLVAEATEIAVSAHDLRRTFTNAAVAAGIHSMHLKGLLNHSLTGGDVTTGYVNLNVEDLRGPAQAVSNQLKKWCKIKP